MKTQIQMKEGVSTAIVARPDGDGPWPAVLVFTDAFGVRPATIEVAEKIASRGFYVLMPNIFYRFGEFVAPNVKDTFADPEKLKAYFAKYIPSLSYPMMRDDAESYLAHLAQSPECVHERIGIVGYCMGGRFALAAAGNFPDRVAAVASYHGGNLATDQPDSPHLLADRMHAEIYVAGAVDDGSFPDSMKERLEKALTDAKLSHRIETYEGCRHGWALSDTPVYNAEGAQKHYDTLLSLMQRALA